MWKVWKEWGKNSCQLWRRRGCNHRFLFLILFKNPVLSSISCKSCSSISCDDAWRFLVTFEEVPLSWTSFPITAFDAMSAHVINLSSPSSAKACSLVLYVVAVFDGTILGFGVMIWSRESWPVTWGITRLFPWRLSHSIVSCVDTTHHARQQQTIGE